MTKTDLLVVAKANWSTVFAGVLVNTSLTPMYVCAHKTSKMVQKSFLLQKKKHRT